MQVIAEQLEVRRRSDAFQKSVDTFSEHFQATAPFHVKARPGSVAALARLSTPLYLPTSVSVIAVLHEQMAVCACGACLAFPARR